MLPSSLTVQATCSTLVRRTGMSACCVMPSGLFRDAVAATPDDDPLRRARLLGLTAGLGLLRRHTSDISLLIEQAQVLRAVAAASDDPAEVADLLLKVSALLRQHLEDEHDVAVLAELVATHRALMSSLGEI